MIRFLGVALLTIVAPGARTAGEVRHGAAAVARAISVQVGADVPLELKGDVAVVKVDKVVVVKEDRTVVKALPFTVVAPSGGLLYSWDYPATWTAKRKANVLEVTAAPKGAAVVSVEWPVVDFKAQTTAIKTGSVAFDVGDVTPPAPPKPDPPKPPTPDPTPAPIPVAGLRALIIYESAELTPSLSDVMSGAKTNDYMASKGVNGGYLKLDKDSDVSGLEPWVSLAWKRPRASLPWLIVSDGKAGFEGPVPKGVDGRYSPALTLEIMRKVGG